MALDRRPADSGSGAMGELSAFIDQGSSFEGKLSFKGTVRVDGHFTGEISSEDTLIVGENGVIEATIRSQVVIVSGTVTGDVVAAKKVVVYKAGRIDGNVKAPSLTMEEGAVVNGQLMMSDKKPSASSSPTEPVPQV